MIVPRFTVLAVVRKSLAWRSKCRPIPYSSSSFSSSCSEEADSSGRAEGGSSKKEIGTEVHTLDQFLRVEEGSGEAVLDGVRTKIRAGFAVVVPAGANHNIINTGDVPLKLYTLYAPPNHRDGVVHHTRDDANADNEHFDGKTTE
jgi:glyoxylate utilization-related uncharacterized protein